MSSDTETRCDEAPIVSTPLEQAQSLLETGDMKGVLALVARLAANNAALQRQLAELDRKRGYKTSEIVTSAQLRLLLTGLEKLGGETSPSQDELRNADRELIDAANLGPLKEESDRKKKKTKKRKRPALRPFPDKLRRVEKSISVPDEERPCPKCGQVRACVGHDVSEVLERIPAELVVRVDKREKLACKNEGCEGSVCRAPLPDKVVAGGRLGPQLVACIVVDKYRDGLPLNRQAQRYQRLGVDLSLSTLVDQVKHVTDAAGVLHQVAMEDVLGSHVMHLDGTGLPVLDKDHPNGKRLGTLWAYVGDGKVSFYLYTATGKKNGQRKDDEGNLIEMGPEDVLRKRVGLVVADASNLFDESFKRDDLIECGCNAHGRRGFLKALDRGDSRAALPIGAYRRLYEFEREARDMSVDERTDLRQRKSKPVFDAILKWCQQYAPYEPPSSPLGAAIQYFINHHEALGRFLGDGSIPIDNTLVERQHIRVALTRKAYLFVGSDPGGDRAAIIYTLLSCCALNDVDPERYLADVLPRLARGGVTKAMARELLPDRWKAARSGSPTSA
jgi:transposase